MDIYSNAVPSSLPEYLFPGENTMEGGDGSVSLEWLSTFVEECLNGGGFTAQPPPIPPATTNTASKPTTLASPITTTATNKKTRTKRRKVDPDSPLVPQAYWLAESELIVLPRKEKEVEVEVEVEVEMGRRCTHCMSQKTPQWRAGPMGPKTLCNACGVRFKSGRLLPEYRPAKSPTFQTYKHSNSHKRVMEMRSSMSSSSSSSSSSSNAN